MTQPKGPPKPRVVPVKWQLQLDGGSVLGPLSTEDLLLKISQGQLTGDEKIRKLPDGSWTNVSREPVFYDQLLEVLDDDQEKTRVGINFKKPITKSSVVKSLNENVGNTESEETRAIVPTSSVPQETTTEQSTQVPAVQKKSAIVKRAVKQNLPTFPALEEKSEKQKPKSKTLGLLRFLFLIILLAAGYLYFLGSNTSEKEHYKGLVIKLPKPGTQTLLTAEQQTRALGEVYKLIFRDSIEDYDQAQTKLVQLIEKVPLSSEARGLLCLVQMNLWPYVQQNSSDMENLKLVKMAGTRLDPVGLAGIHCEVSYLMVTGKYRDAMGIIEHTSNRREVTEESPVLYSVKAEILASEKNYRDAVGWAEAAAKLWPQWARPYYQIGVYNFEIAQNDKAIEGYEKVLFLNPKHRQSLIEYGILIYLKSKDSARSEKFLLAAAKSVDPISKMQEAKLYFYLAKIFGEKGQNPKALEYVQKSFQLNPGDLKARDYLIQLGGSPTNVMRQNQHNELVFLGDQYARAGDYLAAQAEYKAAFEIDQKNALAAMKAAKALWQLYQAEEAMKWLGKAIVADPKLSIPYFLMADYYSQLYNFQGAGDILGRGAQKLPNNADILRGYGLVELRRNNPKQAIAYLERALKITEDVDTLSLLAKAYLNFKDSPDPQKAMSYATKAVQLEDANSEAQIIYAKTLVVTGGLPAALIYIKERIQKFSYTPDYIMGLAEILQDAEKYKEAQAEYEKIFLLDNKNKKALMGLGACYQAQGILDKALKMFLAAAIQDPSDPEPVFKTGMVYMDAGRYKDAQTQFRRGVNINKVYPKGYYYLAKAALAMKDLNLAMEAVNEEKKNNPNLADAYILAGEIYRENREYAKCGAEFQNVVRIRPKGAENYAKMAQCLIWAGSYDIAENMLSIAKEQESGFSDIYKLQGAIFEKKNEVQEACLAYQNYVSLSPNAKDRGDIDNKINRLCGGR